MVDLWEQNIQLISDLCKVPLMLFILRRIPHFPSSPVLMHIHFNVCGLIPFHVLPLYVFLHYDIAFFPHEILCGSIHVAVCTFKSLFLSPAQYSLECILHAAIDLRLPPSPHCYKYHHNKQPNSLPRSLNYLTHLVRLLLFKWRLNKQVQK